MPTATRARGASARAADRQCVDTQRRLAHAHRDALPFLAAGADTLIELQVIAHHGDTREHIRAIADERRALEGGANAAVLDGVSLARREHELTRGDVYLAAAEVDCVNPA